MLHAWAGEAGAIPLPVAVVVRGGGDKTGKRRTKRRQGKSGRGFEKSTKPVSTWVGTKFVGAVQGESVTARDGDSTWVVARDRVFRSVCLVCGSYGGECGERDSPREAGGDAAVPDEGAESYVGESAPGGEESRGGRAAVREFGGGLDVVGRRGRSRRRILRMPSPRHCHGMWRCEIHSTASMFSLYCILRSGLRPTRARVPYRRLRNGNHKCSSCCVIRSLEWPPRHVQGRKI